MATATVIGKGARVHGALSASGNESLVVEGTVDGNVIGESLVTIGQEAQVGGEVRGRDVVIEGAFTRNVYASSSIRLAATADVRGELHAPRVVIDDGALFEGQVRRTRVEPAEKPHTSPSAPPVPVPSVQSVVRVVAPSSSLASDPPASTPAMRAIPELAVPGKRRLHRRTPR